MLLSLWSPSCAPCHSLNDVHICASQCSLNGSGAWASCSLTNWHAWSLHCFLDTWHAWASWHFVEDPPPWSEISSCGRQGGLRGTGCPIPGDGYPMLFHYVERLLLSTGTVTCPCLTSGYYWVSYVTSLSVKNLFYPYSFPM